MPQWNKRSEDSKKLNQQKVVGIKDWVLKSAGESNFFACGMLRLHKFLPH